MKTIFTCSHQRHRSDNQTQLFIPIPWIHNDKIQHPNPESQTKSEFDPGETQIGDDVALTPILDSVEEHDGDEDSQSWNQTCFQWQGHQCQDGAHDGEQEFEACDGQTASFQVEAIAAGWHFSEIGKDYRFNKASVLIEIQLLTNTNSLICFLDKEFEAHSLKVWNLEL